MERTKSEFLSAVIGASGGLAGIVSLSVCPGGACTSCMGCAATAAFVVLSCVAKAMKRGRDEHVPNPGSAADIEVVAATSSAKKGAARVVRSR